MGPPWHQLLLGQGDPGTPIKPTRSPGSGRGSRSLQFPPKEGPGTPHMFARSLFWGWGAVCWEGSYDVREATGLFSAKVIRIILRS